MSYKKFLRITEGNIQLARQTNAYLRRRDKITLETWKKRLLPAMRESQERITTQLKNLPLTEWNISNLKNIRTNINTVVLDFEEKFKTEMTEGQDEIIEFSALSIDKRLATVNLVSPATAFLGGDLVAAIIPLTDNFVDMFGKRMAGILGQKVTTGLLQGKSTTAVAQDIVDAYGIDSQQRKKLNVQLDNLDRKLKAGDITTTEYSKKKKAINKKLESGSMMSYSRAQALAETEMNRASAMAEDDRSQEVASVNPEARKILIDQHRPLARANHIREEARTRAKPILISENFHFGSERARYPRAPNLSAGEVVYCGCTVLIVNNQKIENLPSLRGSDVA